MLLFTHEYIAGLIEGSPRLLAALTIFIAVFIQAIPFLIVGVVLSASIATFVSPALLQRVLPRQRHAAVGAAGVAGLALPGCECGSVPVARRLIDQGAPSAVALTFMLSAPAINPVVLVSTAVAFSGHPEMVAARFAGSLGTALVVGWIWLAISKKKWIGRGNGSPVCSSHGGDGSNSRLHGFAAAARHDLVQAGSFLALGAAVAAALRVFVPAAVYEHIAGNLLVGVLVMAVLAVLLALCSEADAFVAASLTMLPLLPRLVFLVVGPAVDVKLVAMQAGAFGHSFAVRFAPLTFLVAIACGSAAGLVFLGATA
ncbi:permease [Hoyosella sp. YIM 151337]|uniref:permease n=1 Tax=Hoyosella sp. YIM 151337 TaxID=2992742 RepID=UPI0035A98356